MRRIPAPKPAEAKAKTSARSARVTPSKASSGRRKTLKAYSEPKGVLSTVAAAIVRHGLGLLSGALTMIGDLRQRQPAKLTGGRGRVTRVYATGTCHVADRGAIADAAGQAVRANACRRAYARGPIARRPLR